MIPLNNHLKIQPLEAEGFFATQRTTYQEMGTVLEIGANNGEAAHLMGKIVLFDSWLAKKFPVKGETDKFYWFVKYEDLVAYEIPEK